MRILLLAFIAGNWWLQQQESLALWLPVCGACLAGGMAWAIRCHARPVAMAMCVLCVWCCGWSIAAWRAEWRLSDRLDEAWEGRDILLKGAVATLPTMLERGVRFQFDVSESVPPNIVPESVAVTWYEAQPPQPGERWQLRVRLRRPVSTANPHTFDYEYWLLEQGVRATGYVRAGPDNLRLPDTEMRLAWRIERWRDAVRRHLLACMPEDAPYAGVLVALVVGDQRGIAAGE